MCLDKAVLGVGSGARHPPTQTAHPLLQNSSYSRSLPPRPLAPSPTHNDKLQMTKWPTKNEAPKECG